MLLEVLLIESADRLACHAKKPILMQRQPDYAAFASDELRGVILPCVDSYLALKLDPRVALGDLPKC